MLVERVFLVSGAVVKTVFWCFKKKQNFFVFHHEQKEVKQDFVVISKSPLFPTETLRICSRTSWFFFPSVRNGGRNSKRVCRTSSVFFLSVKNSGRNSKRVYRTFSVFFSFRKKRREKILCVSTELVLYFFISGRKFYAWFGGSTLLSHTNFFLKKRG